MFRPFDKDIIKMYVDQFIVKMTVLRAHFKNVSTQRQGDLSFGDKYEVIIVFIFVRQAILFTLFY